MRELLRSYAKAEEGEPDHVRRPLVPVPRDVHAPGSAPAEAGQVRQAEGLHEKSD